MSPRKRLQWGTALVCAFFALERAYAHCPNDRFDVYAWFNYGGMTWSKKLETSTTYHYTETTAPYEITAEYVTYDESADCEVTVMSADVTISSTVPVEISLPDPGHFEVTVSVEGYENKLWLLIGNLELRGAINDEPSEFNAANVYMPVGSIATLTAEIIPNFGADANHFRWDSPPGLTYQTDPVDNDYFYVGEDGKPSSSAGRWTYPSIHLRYLKPVSGLVGATAGIPKPPVITVTPRRFEIGSWVNDRFTLNVFDFDVKLVDALGFVPQWSGGPPTLETPITSTVNSSYNRIGTLTDGASLIVIQLERLGLEGVDTENALGQFDFEGYTLALTDPLWGLAGAKELGSLWSGDKDNLPPLPATVETPGQTTLELDADELAVFYRAPVTWGFGEALRQRVVQIEVRGPNMNAEDLPIMVVPFLLEKPPLVLVHGILSDHTTWDDFVVGLTDEVNVSVHKVSYNKRWATKGIDRSITDIAFQINGIIEDIRRGRIAASRVDYLGHSYGGLNARWWMHAPEATITRAPSLRRFQTEHEVLTIPPELRYRREDNFGLGSMRYLMTIGTPHVGSGWASAITLALRTPGRSQREAYLAWRAVQKPNIDAFSDMSSVGSTVINTIQNAPSISVRTRYIASHASEESSSLIGLTFGYGLGGAIVKAWSLPGAHSDLIVTLSSQRNLQDVTTLFQAVHWKQTGNDSLWATVSATLHSMNPANFTAGSSMGAGP